MSDEGCSCGCGLDRAAAIRAIMRGSLVNSDQAEAMLDSANAARAKAGEGRNG